MSKIHTPYSPQNKVEAKVIEIANVLSNRDIRSIDIRLDADISEEVIHDLIVDYCFFVEDKGYGLYNVALWDWEGN